MKKQLILAGIAVIALASCTKNEVAPLAQPEINFKAVAAKNTKTVLNSAVYPEDLPFGVFAMYLEDGKTWAANGADASAYMDDVKCEFNNEENYAPESKYYWPLEGSLTFVAYSPETVAAAYDIPSKTLSVDDFGIAADAIDDPVDFMYSKAGDAADKTTNWKKYNSYSTNGVQIQFRHSLAQVHFYAKTAEDYGDKTFFYIENITLESVGSKADLEIVNDADPEWTLAAETADYEVYDDNDPGTLLDDEYKRIGGTDAIDLLVIPQDCGDEMLITVTYTMYVNAEAGETGAIKAGSKTVSVKVNNKLPAFVFNKLYKMDLIISAEEILFSPEIVEWDEVVVEKEYELPEEAE